MLNQARKQGKIHGLHLIHLNEQTRKMRRYIFLKREYSESEFFFVHNQLWSLKKKCLLYWIPAGNTNFSFSLTYMDDIDNNSMHIADICNNSICITDLDSNGVSLAVVYKIICIWLMYTRNKCVLMPKRKQ